LTMSSSKFGADRSRSESPASDEFSPSSTTSGHRMTAASPIHFGENSSEQVAYKLLEVVAAFESNTLANRTMAKATADRKWLLEFSALSYDPTKLRSNASHRSRNASCACV
jgi:hypothetical protein